jgi:hypothetical protein
MKPFKDLLWVQLWEELLLEISNLDHRNGLPVGEVAEDQRAFGVLSGYSILDFFGANLQMHGPNDAEHHGFLVLVLGAEEGLPRNEIRVPED